MWPAIHAKQEFLIEILKASKNDNSMLFNLRITWQGIMETCRSLFFFFFSYNIIGTLDFKHYN